MRKLIDVKYCLSELDYELGTTQERIELLNKLLYDENGYPKEYFEKMFDQDERERANSSKQSKEDRRKFVNLLPTCSQALSEDIYECKQIERMADYLLKAPDQPRMNRQQEYSFYDEEGFKKLIAKEQLYEGIAKNMHSGESEGETLVTDEMIDIMGDVNPRLKKHHFSKRRLNRYTYIKKQEKMAFIVRSENYKKEGKMKIYKSELKDPDMPLLKIWDKDIKKLQARVKLELDDKSRRILTGMIKELRDIQISYKRYKKGTIIFKSPLRDSTVIDYDEFDFFDKTHVLALLNMSSRQITADDDLSLILYDLELLMDNIKIRDIDLEVVEMYRGGMIQEEIAEKLGIAQQNINQVLSKLADNVIQEYERIYEDWYYLNKVKGKYKKCSRCGEIKLQNKFSPNKRSPDGVHSLCKMCRNELRGHKCL